MHPFNLNPEKWFWGWHPEKNRPSEPELFRVANWIFSDLWCKPKDDLRCAIASCELRCAVTSCDVRVRTHFCWNLRCACVRCFLTARSAIANSHVFSLKTTLIFFQIQMTIFLGILFIYITFISNDFRIFAGLLVFLFWLSFNTKRGQCLKVSPKMNKRFWKKNALKIKIYSYSFIW